MSDNKEIFNIENWIKEQNSGSIGSILVYLTQEISAIRKDVIDIKTRLDLKAYSLKEIAQGLGYSTQHLRHSPWKMPNFGRPDEGINPGKWFYSTIVKWYAIPENKRRDQWESMSSKERLIVLGRTA
jgi:hypothetical protein